METPSEAITKPVAMWSALRNLPPIPPQVRILLGIAILLALLTLLRRSFSKTSRSTSIVITTNGNAKGRKVEGEILDPETGAGAQAPVADEDFDPTTTSHQLPSSLGAFEPESPEQLSRRIADVELRLDLSAIPTLDAAVFNTPAPRRRKRNEH